MKDGYYRDRENIENNERGRIFEHGADLFFRDRERGYIHEARKFTTLKGRMKVDKIREVGGQVHTIEEKSGRIMGEKDEKQLIVTRELLATGKVHQHILRSVQGEFVSREVRELIKALVRDFPGQFIHQEISRADAREIWARGRQLERGQQLELPQVRETARDHRDRHKTRDTPERDRTREPDTRAHTNEPRAPARGQQQALELGATVETGRDQAPDRSRTDTDQLAAMAAALARGKQLDTARQAIREAVATTAREVTAARAQGREPDAEQLQQRYAALCAGLEVVREVERQNTRDMLTAAGHSREQINTLAPVLEQNREAQRRDVLAQLNEIGKEVRRQEWGREIADHNQQLRQRIQDHTRGPVQSRDQDRQRDATLARAERLFIDPDRAARLDLEKYRAVRDGQHLGYNHHARAHLYQRDGHDPIHVAHQDQERRLAHIARDIRDGMRLEQAIERATRDLSNAQAIEEAARHRSLGPPRAILAREAPGLERGLTRDR